MFPHLQQFLVDVPQSSPSPRVYSAPLSTSFQGSSYQQKDIEISGFYIPFLSLTGFLYFPNLPTVSQSVSQSVSPVFSIHSTVSLSDTRDKIIDWIRCYLSTAGVEWSLHQSVDGKSHYLVEMKLVVALMEWRKELLFKSFQLFTYDKPLYTGWEYMHVCVYAKDFMFANVLLLMQENLWLIYET